jgi:hypothetical protein
MPANRAVGVPQFRRPVVLVPEASGNRAVPGAVAEAAPASSQPRSARTSRTGRYGHHCGTFGGRGARKPRVEDEAGLAG